MEGWLTLWQGCHVPGFGSAVRTAWPDGKSLIEQPAITIAVFDMISNQQTKAAKAGGTS
jgi:hypothetical protein